MRKVKWENIFLVMGVIFIVTSILVRDNTLSLNTIIEYTMNFSLMLAIRYGIKSLRKGEY